MAKEETVRLMRCSLGKAPADVVIKNGQIVNVFTREIYPGDVAILGNRIAAVGAIPWEAVGPQTRIVDAGGAFIVPGLIDSHFHMGGTHIGVAEFAEALWTHGVTSLACDYEEFYVIAGAEGARAMLDVSRQVGLRILYMIPIHMFVVREYGTAGVPMTMKPLLDMLSWPETTGLNEPPPYSFIAEDPESLEILATYLGAGKTFAGHIVDVNDPRVVDAYASAGATSCHESQNTEQALEKLRRGLRCFMRNGSGAPDMPRLIDLIRDYPERSRWSMIVSDEVDPVHMAEKGATDDHIRCAVRFGIDPLTAIQMATINPAQYFRLDDDLGSITPGKIADIILLKSLLDFEISQVIVAGRPTVRDGKMLYQLPKVQYPEIIKSKINFGHAITPADFRLPANGAKARVRVLGVKDGSLVSEPMEAELDIVDGSIAADPSQDVAKLVTMERHTGSGRVGIAFAKGIELKRGAIATTYSHPFYLLLVIGTSDEEMARAANAVKAIGGGLAVVDGDNVEKWALPLSGICAEESLDQAKANFQRIIRAINGLGCPYRAPILALSMIALHTIPAYGLSDLGLFDVRAQQIVPSIICTV